MLARHIWLATMPSVQDIADPVLTDNEAIHFQLKSLVKKLQVFSA
jgi:hypothetical protein